MREFCHRCHGELPEQVHRQSSDDAMLFCPRCSAPQILLPEHMRTEGDAAPRELAAATTGAVPPPRVTVTNPHAIDWRVAILSALAVAAVAATLRVVSFWLEFVGILWFLWLLGGANIAISAYARRRPQTWMNARVGLRIGVVTGLLMCGAMSVASGTAGVALRFGTHTMDKLDEDTATQTKAMQSKVQAWMQERNVDTETQREYAQSIQSPLMRSQEFRAGSTLAGYAFEGLLLLLVSAGVGAMNGMMRGARLTRERRGL